MSNALEIFRSEKKVTYEQLGFAIGVSGAAARRYCKGLRMPKPVIMARIRAVTGGVVTADHFLPPIDAPIGFESAAPTMPVRPP